MTTNTNAAPDLKTVINFLMGDGPLNGFQFGETPEGAGKYWWRAELRRAALSTAAQPPALTGDPAEPRDDSDRIYDRPVGYLPAYELSRLHSGHGAQLRSAKFGPSALDGDVPVYLESSALALVQALIGAQRAINSMKVEAETAAQGDEQMMLEACEQISNEGLDAWMAIQSTLAAAPKEEPAQPERMPLTDSQIDASRTNAQKDSND